MPNPSPTIDPPETSPVCCVCGRPASIHEASQSFCHTCYKAGAARDDRDQT